MDETTTHPEATVAGQGPPVLYRYCCWGKGAQDLLVKHEVYISSPEQWNDPFECRVSVDFALSRDEKVRKYADRLARLRHLSQGDARRGAAPRAR